MEIKLKNSLNINKASFIENLSKKIDGIYIFNLDGCTSCDRYESILKSVDTKKQIFKLDCSSDLDYFISMGMSVMPETRVYKDGTLKLKVKGVPKKDDMEKIFGAKS